MSADIFALFDLIKKKDAAPETGAPEFIVAGLGNPGPKYARTRHNAGFMTLDYLYEKLGIDGTEKSRFKALCRDGAVDGHRVLFLKPQTLMNASGDSVQEAMDYYKLDPSHLIVVSDDVNLAVGRVRVRASGSSGGQKGLESIITRLSTDVFPRVRVGVGSCPPEYSMPDWVLGKIPDGDKENLFFALGTACEAVRLIITEGTESAQGKCNGMKPEVKSE